MTNADYAHLLGFVSNRASKYHSHLSHLHPRTDHIPQLSAHRYIFLLIRETPSSGPQATDFPATQRTAAPSDPKASENLADRMGFDVAAYLAKKGLQVVGASVMLVRPDLESLVDNAKIGASTLVDKVMGK